MFEPLSRQNRHDPMNILVIGGTGFIGQRLVRSLSHKGEKLYLLVREGSLEKAKKTFHDLSSITFLGGDIEKTDLLTNLFSAGEVLNEIDCVIHLAAVYQLDVSFQEAYLKNVIGTQNVLKFLGRLPNLKYFHFFSTYAANQVLKGNLLEDDLIKEKSNFFDNYAKSKNLAENLVRKNVSKKYQTIVHRPGIIVGNSQTGERDNDNGPYYFFDFIQNLKKLPIVRDKLKHLPLPVQKASMMPVVPVDTLVDWCTHIILNPKQRQLSTYHLIPKQPISTKDFLEQSMKCLGLPLEIICIPKTKFFSPLFRLLRIPKELVFYMEQAAHLDRTNLNTDYPQLIEPEFKTYLPILIKEYLRTKT